ncbi:hypothetical protein G4B88_026098 [Cannabis sativa]|uniref:Uncharacterized protein n=1 Tax=Cannabis sativa TaxID=3483 RepID=A0A7J6EDL3_CANSA|nr:hypothetical protein G4B88_026098 [Cannabis sativa]
MSTLVVSKQLVWQAVSVLPGERDDNEKQGGKKVGRNEGRLLQENPKERVCKRLDRAIGTANWCLQFPLARLTHHPILSSDHVPVILDTCLRQQKLKPPFRFLESSMKTLQNNEGFEGVELNHFGLCDKKIQRLRERLSSLQSQASFSCDEERRIQLEMLHMELKMERIWKQKSRELWISQGDCNSKFFDT